MVSERGEVRLASIGLGWWGNMLAAAAASSAPVAACFARSDEAREAFGAKHGADPVDRLEDIWNDPSIDGVLIATPHGVRTALIEQAAAAGKHVFVEKPLALTVAEAEASVAAAARAGIVLQVGHNKRRQTGNRRLKEAVVAGELGQVQHIETNISGPLVFKPDLPEWRTLPEDMPAGGMTPLGVHMIDTIHYLGGGVKKVYAMSKQVAGKLAVDDVTAALLELRSGPLAYLCTLMASGPVNTVGVYGTEANAWTEQDGTVYLTQKRGEPARTTHQLEPIDTLADELAEFVSCIENGAAPETGAPEALAVVEVLEAIIESSRSGREVSLS